MAKTALQFRHNGRDYRLILVGDAAMSPYELMQEGGSVEYINDEPGLTWLKRLFETYRHTIWLNPEPEEIWNYRQSISVIRQIMNNRMFPVTIEGLERGMRLLSK